MPVTPPATPLDALPTTSPEAPAKPTPLLSRISAPWRVWLMVSVTGLLILSEANTLIAQLPSASQRVHALNDVVGPLALITRTAWEDWATIDPAAGPGVLIVLHTLADAFFWIGYGLLGWRILHDSRPGRVLLGVLIGAEFAEALGLVGAAQLLLTSASTELLSWVLAAVSTIKWAATLSLLGYLVLGPLRRGPLRDSLDGLLRGVFEQRLALIVVGVLGFLAVFPAGSILEQIPDIERSWLYLGTDDTPQVQLGVVMFSGFVLLVVAASLFFFGRARARRANGANRAKQLDGPGVYVPWAAFGLGILAIWLVLLWTTTDVVDVVPLVVLVSVTVGLPAVSLGVRALRLRFAAESALAGDLTRTKKPATFAEARRAGDGFTALIISLAALGLVRSFASPALIGSYNADFVVAVKGLYLPATIFFFVGIALSCISFALAARVIVMFDRLAQRALAERIVSEQGLGLPPTKDGTERSTTGPVATIQRTVAQAGSSIGEAIYDAHGAPKDLAVRIASAGFAVASLVLLGAFLFFPGETSSALGTLGSITVLLGAFSAVLSTTALFLSRRNALDVFRLVGFRSTPLVTLLIVVPLIATQAGGSAQLHAINNESGTRLTDTRDTIDETFDAWLTANSGCETTLPTTGVDVLPLVLVATAGGGIRAAEWTIDAYSALTDDGPCAANSVLLSSGVSGGSVGIAIVHGNSEEALATSRDLADDALAIGVAGLFVGDVVGALTGIRVPTTDASLPKADASPRTWHDRAEQIQNAWTKKITSFGTPYNDTVTQPTGAIIFNSTDSISHCKVVVSQVDLNSAVTFRAYDGNDNVVSCGGASAEQAGTIDLRDYYGSCPYSLNWATAAMLSARFPIVTPAARVSEEQFSTRCSLEGDLQLVDGGYIDNSGLGTISDLAPDLARVILAHNTELGARGPFVLPIVLYLHNRPGEDVAAKAQDPLPELFVPATSVLLAPGLQTKPASWFSRIASSFDGVCPTPTKEHPSTCSTALSQLRRTFPDGIVVVAPSTGPSVGVPLGWSLSDMSRMHLQAEMDAQATYTQAKELERRGLSGLGVGDGRRELSYGYFGDLLALLTSTTP
jgi:hypothetical protein